MTPVGPPSPPSSGADPPLLLIAGPTASGKSGLAMDLARWLNGVVINADSMQVYRDLRILSARPTVAEEAAVPHALYGVLDGAETCSVGRWLDLARDAVAGTRAQGRLPILCGGTGLYLKAAMQGLAAVPDVPETARREARALLAAEGPEALHARLGKIDPEMAGRLKPGDSQRLARAWEVLQGTGRSLAAWQADPPAVPPLSGRSGLILLDPPREARREAIRRRFLHMLDQGALAEVEALVARALDPALPVMKAVGVPELAALVRGVLDRDSAVDRAIIATYQFAKRQTTWARGQMVSDLVLDPTPGAQLSESQSEALDNFIRSFLLTGSP